MTGQWTEYKTPQRDLQQGLSPGKAGNEVLAQLVEDVKPARARVCYCSSVTDEEDGDQARGKLGADCKGEDVLLICRVYLSLFLFLVLAFFRSLFFFSFLLSPAWFLLIMGKPYASLSRAT